MNIPATIIFYIPDSKNQSQADFDSTLRSISELNGENFDFLALSSADNPLKLSGRFKQTEIIQKKEETIGKWLKTAFSSASGRRILYLDNQISPITLKKGALQAFHMVFDRDPASGMVYSDYISISDEGNIPVKLLKHHKGRVRDNQDYGKVCFFRRGILREIDFFDEEIQYNSFYDLRLRLSEISTLIHIGNRTDGHLYSVKAPKGKQNVFDYLMAGKDVQIEAEKILTKHLKRINAYLKPGNYTNRPLSKGKHNLLASIVIPVNNRPEFIGTAIKSVQAQTIKNVEVIVVVNGGTEDPTNAEVKRYMEKGDKFDPTLPKVRLITTDINNIGLCLNLGITAADGEYYVQLDSDDRLKIDAVEKIVNVFKSDKTVGMVIGSYDVWEKTKSGEIKRMESIPTVTHDEWTDDNGRNNLLRINGAGAPRSIPMSVAEEIGYFGINEQPYSLNYGEDYEMVLKISEKYRIGRVWDAIYDVIRHSGGTDHSIDQLTIDRNDEAKDHMRLEAIKRRQKMSQ